MKTFIKKWLPILAILVGWENASLILAQGYFQNVDLLFYFGLITWMVLLALGKLLWRHHAGWQITANTLILLGFMLPLVDLIYRPDGSKASRMRAHFAAAAADGYSFEAARGNPMRFCEWWKYYSEEWTRLSERVHIVDPEQQLPFRLKPNSQVKFFDSIVKINSLGFRGREFKRLKTNQYRIIAIGESTTMGATIRPEDRSWPALLEENLNRQALSSRRIQVINGGVWAYTLQDSVLRLERDFLPLKPDMIICYHGYNGFYLLNESLAPVRLGKFPRFEARPSQLLAHCEHRLRMWWYRRQLTRNPPAPDQLAQVRHHILSSKYADLYRTLISWCEANGIRLVLCTFNMAVNSHSPADVISFYGGGFPNVRTEIVANQLHNQLLYQLVSRDREAVVVDTSENLDGVWDQYIDLVHFTQSGREQLANNIFSGIKPILVDTFLAEASPHSLN